MIVWIQIHIGEELAGKVANRQSFSPLQGSKHIIAREIKIGWLLQVAGVDDLFDQNKGLPATNGAADFCQQKLVVDAGKILSDIKLQNIAVTPGIKSTPVKGRACTLIFPVGITVMDKFALQEGGNHVHKRMMHHPLGVRSGADHSRFWPKNFEGVKLSKGIISSIQRLLNFQEILRAPGIENCHIMAKPLAFLRFPGSQVEVFERANFVEEIGVAFHVDLLAPPAPQMQFAICSSAVSATRPDRCRSVAGWKTHKLIAGG